MNEANFHGVFPYLVSPVHETGEVNANVLERLCDDGITPRTDVHLRVTFFVDFE